MAAPDGGGGSGGIFAWVSLGLMTCFVVATVVVALFAAEFPHALDGTPSVGSPAAPNYLRNLLELLSFASNIGLIVTAISAGLYARGQLRATRKQNAAGVYAALYDKVTSGDVQAELRLCAEIRDRYQAMPSSQSLGKFATDTMADWRRTDLSRFLTATNLMTFLEHVGLTVRREYLDMDDVYYLLEGTLKDVAETFCDYLEMLRDASEDKRMCEHAIWLLTKIQDYRPKTKLP